MADKNQNSTEKKNQVENVVDTLLQGMENVINTKTVVGDPMVIGDVTVLPLMDVSFGFGAGAGVSGNKNSSNNAGGIGGKMSPSAVLIIKDGAARVVNVKGQDVLSKLVDMIPDLIDKVNGKWNSTVTDENIVEQAFPDENK